MKACVDVHYRDDGSANVGVLLFQEWSASHAKEEHVFVSRVSGDYQPGEFYRRELAPIQEAIESLETTLDLLIVDGYCDLSPDGQPGLGAHVHSETGIPIVVGVAKNRFHSATHAIPVSRGNSERPLYITAVGISVDKAAIEVSQMHGPFRIPTLLKRVDRLARDGFESE